MPRRVAPSDINHLLTDDAIARIQHVLREGYRPPVELAADEFVMSETTLIDYRSQVYRSIAKRLSQVKTKRDLLSITRALELGALL